DGVDIGWLIYFCFRYPWISVPLLIIVGVMLFFSQQKGRAAYCGSVIRRGGGIVDAARRDLALEKLKVADPQFDEQEFYARVTIALMKIQEAWCGQNLETVRAFVSDGIYERFSLQIQEQRDLGYRNVMENIKVHETVIAQVASDEPFDVVTVRIRASAIDYRQRLSDGNRVHGTMRSDAFVEYWSLLRRRGATTQHDRPGLIEGNCPNCGTDIEMNQSAKCTSCDSLRRSGQHDWVLCEITQACEWQAADEREIPGTATYRKDNDPGFNVQHLEDRASVVFWRRAMADRTGDAAILAKMADAEFCDAYAKQLQSESGDRTFYGDCAVGSVDTLGVLPDQPMDRVLVEIRWSGKRFVAGDGPPRLVKGQGSLFREIFVLGRRNGIKSDAGYAVSSCHCPGCGAPESDLLSNACEFCGEVLSDGSHDWVLIEVLHTYDEKAQRLLGRLSQITLGVPVVAAAAPQAAMPRAAQLLAWTIKLALADNELDAKEMAMLDRVARARGIRPQQLETIIAATRNGQMDVPQPKDREETQQWLEVMADIALADGRIHPAEADLLVQAGEQLQWSRYDLKMLLKRRKTMLYDKARVKLKQKRSIRPTAHT
ncbi:MAG TPA: TIM44-like domain-containing protein, partial [Thermoguttaceae bacterium]|nr:TIM44-like domain-containing protein [Thermoguttaceae bacterium]